MPRFNPQLPVATVPVWKLTLNGIIFGQRVQNTFFYMQQTGQTVIPSNTLVAEKFRDSVAASWADSFTIDYIGDSLKADRMEFTSDLPALIVGNLFTGNVDGPADRSIVAVRMYRQTSVAGQRGRGMIRVCGTPETDLQDNFVTAGGQARLVALRTALGANIPTGLAGAGNLIPCLATAVPVPGTPGARVVRADPITGWTVGIITGSQDTRKDGVGR